MKTTYFILVNRLASCCKFTKWLNNQLFRVMLFFMIPGIALAQPPKASLDQARNGSQSNPLSPVAWTNGNLNATQAHYRENYSVPYRVGMKNLPVNVQLYIDIEYDTKHSGRHAIDFLSHY